MIISDYYFTKMTMEYLYSQNSTKVTKIVGFFRAIVVGSKVESHYEPYLV